MKYTEGSLQESYGENTCLLKCQACSLFKVAVLEGNHENQCFCGGEWIANVFTGERSFSSQRMKGKKPSKNWRLLKLRLCDPSPLLCVLHYHPAVPPGFGSGTGTCPHASWSSVSCHREQGCVFAAESKQCSSCVGGAWSDGAPFAGTNCAWTLLSQQWSKWVYTGLVLC